MRRTRGLTVNVTSTISSSVGLYPAAHRPQSYSSRLTFLSVVPASSTPPQPGQRTFQDNSKNPSRAACRNAAIGFFFVEVAFRREGSGLIRQRSRSNASRTASSMAAAQSGSADCRKTLKRASVSLIGGSRRSKRVSNVSTACHVRNPPGHETVHAAASPHDQLRALCVGAAGRGRSVAGRELGVDARQHRLDLGFDGGELLRIARAHHHVGVGAALLVHERIGADDHIADALWRSRRARCRCRPRGNRPARSPTASWLRSSACGATYSSIACMTCGMPAMTMTLPIRKPGAAEILLSTSSAPAGIARHAHARLVHDAAGLRKPLAQNFDRVRVIVDRHAERLGDGVGGDVVVGRADAAGGEDVGVARRAAR